MTRLHVIPIGDTREHELNDQCWCSPLKATPGVFVHNALDCREKWERQGLEMAPGWAVVDEATTDVMLDE